MAMAEQATPTTNIEMSDTMRDSNQDSNDNPKGQKTNQKSLKSWTVDNGHKKQRISDLKAQKEHIERCKREMYSRDEQEKLEHKTKNQNSSEFEENLDLIAYNPKRTQRLDHRCMKKLEVQIDETTSREGNEQG
jgi:hypothetical protein